MKKASPNQIERLPLYLKTLKLLKDENVLIVSSAYLANELGFSEEQVRKDLQLVSKKAGKPKTGRSVNLLISDIEDFLGYKTVNEAIVIGVGNLGHALMSYQGFNNYGLNIIAGFDIDENKIGTTIAGKPIYDINDLEKIEDNLHTKLVILTTPSDKTMEIYHRLKKMDIKAIWNFAPIHLKDNSKKIIIENVDLATLFAKLSHKIKEKECQ